MLMAGTCSATDTMRGMNRPSPMTVRSTMVSTPLSFSSCSRWTAVACASSSSHSAEVFSISGTEDEDVLVHEGRPEVGHPRPGPAPC